MTRKAARSCSNRKAVRSRDDYIVVSAGAVDHQQAAVLGSALKDKEWFMAYLIKWLWYNSDDGENED